MRLLEGKSCFPECMTNRSYISVLTGTVFAAGICMGTTFVNEDLFLSFAAGRDVALGMTAQPDHWSFTAVGSTWVNQAWLSHLLFYLVHDKLGAAGPVLLKALLLTCCCLAVLFQSYRMTLKIEPSMAALTCGLIAAGPFMGIRPENFGLLFFVILLLLLTVDFHPFSLRAIAIASLPVCWSNFHGSFMLGLVLLVVKALLEGLRSFGAVRSKGRFFIPGCRWWLIAVFALLGTAMVNPFGIENLIMPFRQVGTETVTGISADWLPLFGSGTMGHCLFGTAAVYPFIFFAFCVICASVTVAFRLGSKNIFRESSPNDMLMLLVAAGICLVAAVKFRRLILFSAFSMVPLAAIGFNLLFTKMKKSGRRNYAAHAISLSFAVVTGLLFYYTSVVPHLPGNTMRPQGGVVKGLMSYGSFSDKAAQFISRNNLYSKVLSGWEFSAYLMFFEPRIKLFMDCRDQSFYPVSVVRDYFTILGVMHSDAAQALNLLDRYGVETVVLTTNPIDFDAAVRLLGSRKWKSLYADTESMVLVRSESSLFNGTGSSLWFPDADSPILSASLNSYFDKGVIGYENENYLKAPAARKPWPNYYVLIFGASTHNRCERGTKVSYLLSEIDRLEKLRSGKKHGDPEITECLVTIHEILASNAAICGDGHAAELFLRTASELRKQNCRMRSALLGKIFCLE